MSSDSAYRHFKRPLYSWEIAEARRVFGDGLDYSRVWIHECNPMPDRLDRIGKWLRRQVRDPNAHNAITIGNQCHFPVRLPEQLVTIGHPEYYKLGWLMHELTHAWQYQQLGWKYLWLALRAQSSAEGYNFGGEEGLKTRAKTGWNFRKFNLEQQGDITKSYYEQLCKGGDLSAWEEFIGELRGERKFDKS